MENQRKERGQFDLTSRCLKEILDGEEGKVELQTDNQPGQTYRTYESYPIATCTSSFLFYLPDSCVFTLDLHLISRRD